ncbi:MAG TPA: glycosyltransferase family 4 protein [Candidatus Absconditabacterales bacterium]|nr:glycosyltransferase family 4 protein [Candidatus Absconditabacterales bacterium]
MTILFILDHFKPYIGGAEVLFDNLSKGLHKKGIKTIILTTRFSKDLPEFEKVSELCEIHRVGSNRYNFMRSCLRKGISLARKSDLIHTTTYNAAIPASLIAWLTQKKVVITVHEIFSKLRYRFVGRKGLFYNFFERLIFQFHFDKYICVSNYTKNCMRVGMGIDDSKLKTIYNGIDYDLRNKNNFESDLVNDMRKQYLGSKSFLGLFFGRPGISKGLPYFLQSIPLIKDKIPDFKAMLIVGKDDKKRLDAMNKLINELQIEDNITMILPVPYSELGYHILASDFVVVPSLAEGFGFAAAEVSALEKELVVTNIGSLPEVVSGKINFIEPSNPVDMANKIMKFYKKEYTIIPAKKFLWNDTVEYLLETYQEIVGK